MRYRHRFRRARKRRSTSKTLRRASSTTVGAVDGPSRSGGRRLVLRANAKQQPSEARPKPEPPLDRRFRVDAEIRREGPVRLCHVFEPTTGRLATLATCELAGSNGWDAWERFEHGCKVLRSLRHRGVAVYREHAEHESVQYLLMDRIPGESIEQGFASLRRYSDPKLRHMLRRGVEALSYLAELNPPLAHGDVHPGSLFVSERGHVCLTSFERAVTGRPREYDPLAHDWRVGYAAPELLVRAPDFASDVHALGATVLAAACGCDVSELPTRGDRIDVEASMRAGPVRDTLAALLHPDPARRLEAASLL